MKEKEYRITEASLEKLNQTIEEELEGHGTLSQKFKKIFAALCVPVPEVEGWMKDNLSTTAVTQGFYKGDFYLWCWKTPTHWYLYKRNQEEHFIANRPGLLPSNISEAQAWADKVIEEWEKGEESAKTTCPNCEGRGTVWKTSIH